MLRGQAAESGVGGEAMKRGRVIRAARAAGWVAVLVAMTLARTARADDASWPRQFESASDTFVIYQPQPEELTGDLLMARAAFSLQRAGHPTPTFGVLWFNARLLTDRDSSTVTMRNLDVTKVRLPDITPAEASRYESLVETEAARWDLSGSLAELQAGLASAEKERAGVAALDNSPPRIVFRNERALLLLYDGTPLLEPMVGTKLERVSNTPYAVVFDHATQTCYLNGANLWYRASDPLGPWTPIAEPPPEVRAVVPPDTIADDRVEGAPPAVVTATEPTELISIDGPPKYAPLVGDELLYITNTEGDVVREVSTQAIYVLLGGRWYRAPSTAGPWTFVRGDQLPPSFRKVPPDSPKGHILASVAGTGMADDAVADAGIPQTSAIRRGVTDFMVTYDGAPQFEPIAGTRLRYAVNADAEVILADGRYYACDQGVWYFSDTPEGPWSVSDTRPVGLDDIPPTCPVYGVRYVYIYDWTPDIVYVGYLPGYVGCYPYYGTVVYGTGYRYKPWRRRHYYPWPCTWGYHARYNPWQARWGFGFTYWSGFLRVGFRWGWEPNAPHRHPTPRWLGPGGFRRPPLAPDGTMMRTRRPSPRRPDGTPNNLYQRPRNVVRSDPAASRMPLRPIAAPRTVPKPNNVYAGKDGKVYQRDGRGNWQVNENRQWKPTPAPVAAPPSEPKPAAPSSPPSQPMPVTPNREGSSGVKRPPPPVLSPVPGNLERESRGRERAHEPPAAPANPKTEPARAPAKDKNAPAQQAPAKQTRPKP
jgi:hypothetical protein